MATMVPVIKSTSDLNHLWETYCSITRKFEYTGFTVIDNDDTVYYG